MKFLIRVALLVTLPFLPVLWCITLIAHGWLRRPTLWEIEHCWMRSFSEGRF